MNRASIFITILSLLLLVSTRMVSAQESPTPDPLTDQSTGDSTTNYVIADQVIAIVGNAGILYSDIVRTAHAITQKRKEQGSLSDRTAEEEALEMLLVQNLMATCAVMDSLDKDMPSRDVEIESIVGDLVEGAGGVKALEKEMGKPIYQIKADIALEDKQVQLARQMQDFIRYGVDIDYVEVAEFLDTIKTEAMSMIPMQYSYSQIVKIPPQTDERKYAIRERLLEYRKRILAGEVSLGVLAQLYSLDPGSALKRGEMGPMPIMSFTGPFADAIRGMKDGEVSGIVETEYGYHLIELISFDRKTEMAHIRHILLKPEFTVEESKDVVELLDSIATEVRAERLDFAEAAMQYSDDKATKENGGKAFNKMGYQGDIRATSSRFVAEELMTEARYITVLNIGDVSQPYEAMDEKGNLVQKIVQLDTIIPAHRANLRDDYDLLEAMAQAQKQSTAIERWIEANIHRVYVLIAPEYLDYDLGGDLWREAALRTQNRENIDVEFPTFEQIEEAVLKRAAQRAKIREAQEKIKAAMTENQETEDQNNKDKDNSHRKGPKPKGKK